MLPKHFVDSKLYTKNIIFHHHNLEKDDQNLNIERTIRREEVFLDPWSRTKSKA